LIHHLPKGDDSLPLRVEEILEESAGMSRGRIGIALSVLAHFGDPILGLMGIDDFEELVRIQVGSPAVM
jgi:hypothetical protein